MYDTFKRWKAEVERESGVKLKTPRTDNGGEYLSGEFKKKLESEGVRHELSNP